MSTRARLALLLATLATLPAASAAALGSATYLIGYEPGEKDAVTGLLEGLGASVVDDLDALDVLEVKAPSLLGVGTLLGLDGVSYVEPDSASRLAGAEWNGAQWNGAQWNGAEWNGAQWNGVEWNGAAVPTGGEWGHAVVDTRGAWRVEHGHRSASLCVVDSGVDWDHPDLAANAWTGADGAHGWNALTGTSDARDDAGHGTHVAGIAAAVHGNSMGVAGVSNSLVMSAKVLGADGRGKISDLAAGMVWCADRGADVVLLALAVDGAPRTIDRAIAYLDARDAVIVASAGNSGPCASCVAYPARDARVVAVGAIGPDLKPAAFSVAGPEIDLLAPGVDILSTFDGGRYATGSGTSQAAAWAAGVAALVREHDPDADADEVRHALASGSVAGVLDARGALVGVGG